MNLGASLISYIRFSGMVLKRGILLFAVTGTATMAASAVDSYNSTPPYKHISLTTNALYDLAITPDIGMSIGLGRNISLAGDFMYGWWSKTSSAKCWRITGGNLEGRYHFTAPGMRAYSGHYVGIYASTVKYDFRFGASSEGQMSDGYNYAAGISYGYTLPLTQRLSLNFSVGIGYLWGHYMKYRRIDECDVWQSTHSRQWFGPTKAEVSLVWHISGFESKKGGKR